MTRAILALAHACFVASRSALSRVASAALGSIMTLAMLALAPVSSAATIGDCGGANAPSGFFNETCASVCDLVLGIVVSCNLVGGGTAGAEVLAVEDFEGLSSRNYSIWGSIDGDDFCCFVDDTSTPDIISLVLDGTDFADELSFSFTTRNVTNAATFATGGDGIDILFGSDVSGQVDDFKGGLGADTITGQAGADQLCGADCSNAGASLDTDTIHGDNGNDDIFGDGGADVLFGDQGSDEINGMNGNDEIHGGDGVDVIGGHDGADTINGGADNDEIDGDDGDDNLSGDGGADTIFGGNGDDEVCSGAGTGDDLNGGPSAGAVSGTNDDQIWAAASAVSPTGSVVGNNANCGDNNAGFGFWNGNSCGTSPCCTYSRSNIPPGCP